MTAYDPNTHRTVVAANGEANRKFYAVNKLLIDMNAAGLITVRVQDSEPGDTTVIWLDISDPEAANAVPKAYDSGSWVALTPSLFLAHLGGGGVDYQPLDTDLTEVAALSTTSYGRSVLTTADAAALRTLAALVIGTDVQAYDPDLSAVAALSGTGLAVRSASNTWVQRSLANASAGLTWTNGDGVSGNPTPVLANDLAALEGLSSTGLAARTASDTWAQRTITGPAAGITVSNGDGVSGNPTLALANDLAALEALSGTNTIYYRSASDTWTAVTIGGLLSFSGGTLNVGDAELTAIAGLTSAADKVPYFTGSGAASTADFTSAGRSMVGAASAAAQTALLSAFVGDSGSGGTKGLVPAPASGDATKFLRGDGTFVTIPGGGDALTSNPLSQFAATTSAQLAGVISDETGSGALVFATSPALTTPNIGTPSAGTLTNCSGLPVSGITASTSTALGVGSIELGHASDTTISRTGAGAIAVEGVGVALNSTSLVHTCSTLELGNASDTTLSRSAAGVLAVEGTIVKMVGKETIWVPAAAMFPRITNGPSRGVTELSTNDIMLPTLDFDTTTEEGAGFWIRMPKSYNAGTVTFSYIWTAASGSGGVVFSLAGRAFADDDAMDQAVGTVASRADTFITANDMHVATESGTITLAGTPAAEIPVYFQITRTVANGSDTLAVDAKLIGVFVHFTTNAATDA